MVITRSKVIGRRSIFRDKIRKPVSITLTAEHHAAIRAASKRTGLTRADCIGVLIGRYAWRLGPRGVTTVARSLAQRPGALRER